MESNAWLSACRQDDAGMMNRRIWITALCLALVFAPLVVRDVVASWNDQEGGLGGDYLYTVFKPGHDIVRSLNPYPSPDSDTLQSFDAVYPPFLFVVAVPLTLLPWALSASLWIFVLIAACVATPWLVGVRDPRCIVLWLFSVPVVEGVSWGNATMLVVFAAAVAWYFRDRPRLTGAALGAGISIKVLLAPLLIWLLFTRRISAAVLSVVFCATFVVIAWAGIGFDGLTDYPALARGLSEAQTERGLFLAALLAAHGRSVNVALAVGALPALCIFWVAWHRRRHDAAVFALSLIAILWLTPVNHSFNVSLMMLAVAVVYPRLSLPWVLMPLLWLIAFDGPFYGRHPDLLIVTAMTLTVAATIAVVAGTSAPGQTTGLTRPHASASEA